MHKFGWKRQFPEITAAIPSKRMNAQQKVKKFVPDTSRTAAASANRANCQMREPGEPGNFPTRFPASFFFGICGGDSQSCRWYEMQCLRDSVRACLIY
jgi:hypothetical protein